MDRDLREQIPIRAKTPEGSLRSRNQQDRSFLGVARLGPRALLAQLVEHLHGKEGVDGSSPSEGSTKGQQMASLRVQRSRQLSVQRVPNLSAARSLRCVIPPNR